MPVLEVRDLRTSFRTADGLVRAVDGVSFHVNAGETLGLVGESGCGKSVTALSIMRLIPTPPGLNEGGEILFGGRDVLGMTEADVRSLRGRRIAMVFQDPMTSLNPVLTVGFQISEALQRHLGMDRRASRARTVELLEQVGIPSASKRFDDYPHQFSGGMRQRAMIAMAMSCDPELILADEITTALDVTIQAQILELFRSFAQDRNAAALMITHDLGIVAGMTQRVHVMYGGRIVEKATTEELFENPRMPYTWGLMSSIPRLDEPRPSRLHPIEGVPPDLKDPPKGCRFEPRCRFSRAICEERDPELIQVTRAAPHHESRHGEGTPGTLVDIAGLTVHFPIMEGVVHRRQVGAVRAVDGVDLTLRTGQTLGLVGESGSGKSTLGRAILRLVPLTAGSVTFDGVPIQELDGPSMRRMRRRMQMIFQDPYASLNPRMKVSEIIAEPLVIHGVSTRRERRQGVRDALVRVGLDPAFADRYPHEFSGGQLQRIGVARALTLDPELIVADEPVSALDVSIQAQLVNLLEQLQDELGLTYLFIAHDLAMVRHISDRVAVMYLGKIMEEADRDAIYERPLHPYTQALLSAVPIPDPKIEARRRRILLTGDIPSPAESPSGCRFRTRCFLTERLGNPEICSTTEPPLIEHVPDHRAACHFVEESESTIMVKPIEDA